LRLLRWAIRLLGGQSVIITATLELPPPLTGQAERAALAALRADYFRRILRGSCPHCEQPITQLVQQGRCVFAVPCQHRLYPGIIPTAPAAKE